MKISFAQPTSGADK